MEIGILVFIIMLFFLGIGAIFLGYYLERKDDFELESVILLITGTTIILVNVFGIVICCLVKFIVENL